MEFDSDNVADKLAKVLDEGTEEEAAQMFRTELADAGSSANRKELISKIDEREEDFTNLDLIVKRDQSGEPEAYTILPKEQHESARQMATLMDAGNVTEASRLGSSVRDGFGGTRDEPRDSKLAFGRWSIAVDAYEKNQVGEDVTINYFQKRSTNPRYTFRFHRREP